MKRTILIAVVSLILSFVFNYAYAQERITLSTYYPAPYGEYRKLAIGSSAGGYTAPTSDDIDLVVEGNVGIGTTTPTGILHVVGGTEAPGMDGTNITLEAQNGGWGNRDGGNIILLPGTGGGPVGGADGNVGIGTASPQERLDIVDASGDGAIKVGNTTGTNAGTIRWTGTAFEGYNGTGWVPLGGGGFGEWTNKDSGNNTLVVDLVYKVTSDGFVCVVAWGSIHGNGRIEGFTDSSNPPTTRRVGSGSGYADVHYSGITIPVKKNDYWKVTTTNMLTPSISWIPIGSGSCERQ